MVQGHGIRVQDGVLYEKSKPDQLEPTQARTAQLESVVLSILFLPFLDKRLTTFHNVKEEVNFYPSRNLKGIVQQYFSTQRKPSWAWITLALASRAKWKEKIKLKVTLGETLYWFAKKCEYMHYYNCNYLKDRQMAKQLM